MTAESAMGKCEICESDNVQVWNLQGTDYCRECKDWLLKMKADYEQAAAKRLDARLI